MNPEIISLINRYLTLLENNRALHQRIITANFAHEQNTYNLISSIINNNSIGHRFSSRTRLSPLNNRSRGNMSLFNLNNLFEDVIIRPSQEQINNATRTLLFRDVNEPINIQCPISRENFNPDDEITQIIHCGHIFCKNSISRWFTTSVHCPVCRYDIRTSNTSDSNTSESNESSSNESSSNESSSNTSTSNVSGTTIPSEQGNNLNNILNSVLSEFNNSTQDSSINNLLNIAEQLNTSDDNNTNGFDILYTIRR